MAPSTGERRPAVSVIVPFAGQQSRLVAMLDRLGRLELRDGDEALLVDNRTDAAGVALAPASHSDRVRLLAAPERASSWYARNLGAADSTGAWLLFIDADTRPPVDLLDRYFEPPPGERVGVLAGGVRDWTDAETLCARYVSARRKMDQRIVLEHPYRPYAQTANCLVRRSAFEAVGGFNEERFAAGDADLCWRLQDAGWRLDERADAYVEHENRTRFRDLFAQLRHHGSGLEWLERRYPGSAPRPRPRELAGRIPHYLRRAVVAGDADERLFALADLGSLYARDLGRLRRELTRP